MPISADNAPRAVLTPTVMSESFQEEPAIAFSILRLSKPHLVSVLPVKLSLERDIQEGQPLKLEPEDRERLVAEEGFSRRVDAPVASSLCGLGSSIQLPSGLTNLHLGESVVWYVSACNNAGCGLKHVEITVEVTTQRSKTVLYENHESMIQELKSDEVKDLLLCYDIKDVGEHQLKCTAVFTDARNERKTLPAQVVNFVAVTPLAIKTKVRSLGEGCLLETCLECLKTDEPLLLEYIRFDPVSRYRVTPVPLTIDDGQPGPLKQYINAKASMLMDRHRCMRNFLFHLKPETKDLPPSDLETSALGKLEVKWRTSFGEFGRLQTQLIQGIKMDGSPQIEAIGRVISVTPQPIVVYRPFEMTIRLKNCTDDTIGPIAMKLLDEEDGGESAIRVSGVEAIRTAELPGRENRDVTVRLISLSSGVQSVRHLKLIDESTGTVVGRVEAYDVFVQPMDTDDTQSQTLRNAVVVTPTTVEVEAIE